MTFNNLVKEIVTPQLCEYNYSIIEESPGFISFESPNVEIRYTYDHLRSKDMIVFIKRNSDDAISFTISDYYEFLQNLLGKTIEIERSNKTEDWVRHTLSLLLLDNMKLIKGELKYLLAIENYVYEKHKKYHEAKQLKSIETKCQKAWKEKNYELIVELLEPVYNKVSKSLRMKYNYALKKLNRLEN